MTAAGCSPLLIASHCRKLTLKQISIFCHVSRILFLPASFVSNVCHLDGLGFYGFVRAFSINGARSFASARGRVKRDHLFEMMTSMVVERMKFTGRIAPLLYTGYTDEMVRL